MNLLLHYGICATLEEVGGLTMSSETFRRYSSLKSKFNSPFFCLNSFHAPLKKVAFLPELQHI